MKSEIEIKKLRLEYDQELYRLHEDYLKTKKEIENKLYLLRKECLHTQKTFCPEQYDSYFSCDICGKEAKRL